MELEADTLYLGYEANDEITFMVTTHNLMWDVAYTENDWCTLTPNPSQGGGEILVAVTENTTGADREMVVTVTNGDLAEQFVVLQSYNSVTPATTISVEQTTYELARQSANLKVAVEANGGYTVVIPSDCNWVGYDGQTEVAEGNYEEAFYISENFGDASREVVVALKSLNTTTEITITQWGKDDLRVATTEMIVGYVAGRDSVQVTSPNAFTATSSSEWLTVDTEASTDEWVYFDYTENEDTENSREAVLTIKTAASTKTVTITQLKVSNSQMPAGDDFKADLNAVIKNITSADEKIGQYIKEKNITAVKASSDNGKITFDSLDLGILEGD